MVGSCADVCGAFSSGGYPDYDKSMIITGEKVTEFCNSVFDAFIENIRRGNKCYESNICQVVSNLLDRRNNDILHNII